MKLRRPARRRPALTIADLEPRGSVIKANAGPGPCSDFDPSKPLHGLTNHPGGELTEIAAGIWMHESDRLSEEMRLRARTQTEKQRRQRISASRESAKARAKRDHVRNAKIRDDYAAAIKDGRRPAAIKEKLAKENSLSIERIKEILRNRKRRR